MTAPRQKPKRKYQVFISSTFSDLSEARQQAVLGVVKAGHFPLALEYAGPKSASKLNVIEEAIAECQYYVIILGHRYGSIGSGQLPGQEKSYVELELDYAESKKLQILAFVMREEKIVQLRNQLKLPDDAEERNNEQRYWRFYRRLTDPVTGPFYRPFSDPADVFVELFGYFSKDHDEVKGYIPEPVGGEEAEILNISAGNEILRDTIIRLGQFKFVDPRLGVAKDKKLALAKAFVQLHGEHVGSKWKKLFIESGSTVAYVAKELAPHLPRMGGSRGDRRVITNNSLAYLYLWLCAGVLCHPEPEGPPDNKYGGMFGALTDRDRIPDYRQPPLDDYDPDAVALIKEMSKTVFDDPAHNRHSILLAAASGLQLSDEIRLEGSDGMPEGLRDCRGFHGGSYPNRLFKRCMYLSGTPTFVFMHDDKIDSPVRPGICHFLCDSGYPWSKLITDYPLALWIACDRETVAKLQPKVRTWLKSGEWIAVTYGESTLTPILMATNRAFRTACERIGLTLPEARCRATS